MSVLHPFRRIDDTEEIEAQRADALEQRRRVDESGGRLTFLTESLRRQNETNHFVQRLQAAYGKGYTDGRAAGAGA